MSCETIHERLTLYLLGDLSPAEATEVRQHLEHCAACRAAVHELEQTLDLLHAGLTAVPAGTPARLDEAHRQVALAAPRKRLAGWELVLFRQVLPLAASLVVVVGVLFVWVKTGRHVGDQPPPAPGPATATAASMPGPAVAGKMEMEAAAPAHATKLLSRGSAPTTAAGGEPPPAPGIALAAAGSAAPAPAEPGPPPAHAKAAEQADRPVMPPMDAQAEAVPAAGEQVLADAVGRRQRQAHDALRKTDAAKDVAEAVADSRMASPAPGSLWPKAAADADSLQTVQTGLAVGTTGSEGPGVAPAVAAAPSRPVLGQADTEEAGLRRLEAGAPPAALAPVVVQGSKDTSAGIPDVRAPRSKAGSAGVHQSPAAAAADELASADWVDARADSVAQAMVDKKKKAADKPVTVKGAPMAGREAKAELGAGADVSSAGGWVSTPERPTLYVAAPAADLGGKLEAGEKRGTAAAGDAPLLRDGAGALLNSLDYGLSAPETDPVSLVVEAGPSPLAADRRLLFVAVKAPPRLAAALTDVRLQVSFTPGPVNRHRAMGGAGAAAEGGREAAPANSLAAGQQLAGLYEWQPGDDQANAVATVTLSGRGPDGNVFTLVRKVETKGVGASMAACSPAFRLAAGAALFTQIRDGRADARGLSYADVGRLVQPADRREVQPPGVQALMKLVQAAAP